MDHFFDLFVKAAGRRLREYAERRDRAEAPLHLLRERIEAVPIEGTWDQAPLAAVDGGIGAVKLSNGHTVLLARAAAVGPNIRERSFLVDVAPVDSASLPWAHLVMVEADVALAALDRGAQVLLMDGSLYAKALRLVHNLILAREFQSLYYMPEFAAALYSLARLLEEARDRGAAVVFVSKDSHFKLVKEQAIFEALLDRHPLHLFKRGLEWYSVLWLRDYRKALMDAYRGLRASDPEAAQLIAMLFMQHITDAEVLSAALPPGTHTRPVLMGSCDAYMNHRGLTSMDRILEAARARMEDAKMLRLRGLGDEPNMDRAMEYLERAMPAIPRTRLFYLRPKGGDAPLMAEVPAWEAPMFQWPPVKAVDFRADVGPVAAMLASQYRDPIHYNIWLWYAHDMATFRGGQLAEYAVYVRKMAEDPGARRLKMGLGI